jgi:Crp-like helix-turn-helix domain
MGGEREPPVTPVQARAFGAELWPTTVDLRSELADDTAKALPLSHPLPVRLLRLPPGPARFDWLDPGIDCHGVMLLDGLLLGELDAGRAHTGWLLGRHDLIRPSGLHERVLTERVRWRTLAPTAMAVLDHEFGVRAGGIPMVARVLLTRATQTTNWLLSSMLILSSPVVEERLLLLFTLLGERWGRVTADGVVLRLPLTHAILAMLCGARRPSVTIGLHALERDGLLTCAGKGRWILRRERAAAGPDPGGSSCLWQYERALGLN